METVLKSRPQEAIEGLTTPWKSAGLEPPVEGSRCVVPLTLLTFEQKLQTSLTMATYIAPYFRPGVGYYKDLDLYLPVSALTFNDVLSVRPVVNQQYVVAIEYTDLMNDVQTEFFLAVYTEDGKWANSVQDFTGVKAYAAIPAIPPITQIEYD